jgi:levanbiose-producing levanase
MTHETGFTRRTTLGMFASLPMLSACGETLVGAGTGSAATGPVLPAPRPTVGDGRPRYHIAAPAGGWINDPQRPLKIGDSWTLWALYNPTYPKGGTNWRRWTSKDLVTWQDQGIAIPRNTTGNGDVWSGSTVVDTDDTAGFGAGTLVTLVTMPVPGSGQSCALWYSRDGGASFTFHAIVLPNVPGNKDFRDPTVFWHAPTRRWVMTLSEEGRIGLYTSPDLKRWTHASGFASQIVGRIMECSHLFPLHLYDRDGKPVADKWILLVGGNGTSRGFTVGTYYWTGDFNGTTFTADAPEGQWLDGGADYYAAVVWTDPAADDPLASAYSIGWMSNWDYVNKIPATHGYKGQLSIVRRLRLQLVGNVPRLSSTPLDGQNAVFAQTIAGRDQTIAPGSDYVWPAGAGATSCRIDLTLTRVGVAWPAEVLLSVRMGDGFYTQIAFALPRNTVSIKRDTSGPNAPDIEAWRERRSVAYDVAGGTAKASLFIDSGSVELFLGDGSATMSELITAPMTATGLQLAAAGESVAVSHVAIHRSS